MASMRSQCPLCAEPRSVPVPQHEAHHLRRCSACSFIFSGQVPSSQELADYYSTYPGTPPLTELTRQRFHELLRGMEQLAQGRTMLDVGCGKGDLLDVARSRGWHTHGTEFHPQSVALGRSKGHRMEEGPLRVENYADQRFDLIVSVEVLEHLSDPLEEVRRMAALLAPGGVLYITTPNFNALNHSIAGARWRLFNHPEHLCFFTPGTIARCFRSVGLDRIRVRTTGFSPDRYREPVGASQLPVLSTEDLRERIERNMLLRWARSAANTLLSLTGRGDTLKAWYRKPVQ